MIELLDEAIGVAVATGYMEDLEKEVEKGIILAMIPFKKSKKKSIKRDRDQDISDSSQETKQSLETIASELDKDIKGKFSKAIKNTIKNHASDYDDLLRVYN
ncbi:hypothetical protein ACVR0S_03495 [Streptococcus dentapri]|uniref:Phage protein n=1 Tax=Streptococcus dentapri TaxID=573564 RepID=A0ABV8D237_9STRE